MWAPLTLLVLPALCMALGAGSLPGVTTVAGEDLEEVADVSDQVGRAGYFPVPEQMTEPLWRYDAPPNYVKIDSLFTEIFIAAGAEYAVLFDYSETALSDSILPYTLTSAAWQAVDVVPDWLAMDLVWSFSLLSGTNQDRYANLILGTSDPLVDEVAFQVAHLSWTILGNPNWDESLITDNASWIYTIDSDLQYVEIIDYPGSDYYSTTEYTAIVDGDTTQVEIPAEIYYWWIVMPKLSDEPPLKDSTVYDIFWREYLYTHNDTGYPLMSDIMAPVQVIWDGLEYNWPGGRAFTDSMMAVDAIGNWCSETVPFPASGNRPIQPNVIAHEHNGNCGEMQDLLAAACRTCLIPVCCTMDILEDHVWCEMPWLGEWVPYQVELGGNKTQINNPGIAYDPGKQVSCIWDWRNDGFTWDAVGKYTDHCTLTVTITDSVGLPVDNARVTIASEKWQQTTLGRGSWHETDQNGISTFILGDNQDFYVNVISPLGNYPAGGYALLIENSQAGEHYTWEWSPPDSMPHLDYTEGTPGTCSKYLLEFCFDLPYDVQNGRDFYANPRSEYAEPLEDGVLCFFAVDRDNLLLYLDDEPYEAYLPVKATADQIWFHIPLPRDYFLVLSGREHAGFSTYADVSVRLWEHDGTGISGAQVFEPDVRIVPSPFSSITTVSFSAIGEGSSSLLIYGIDGRLVRSIDNGSCEAGTNEIVWDGRDHRNGPVPSGLYFLHLTAPGIDSYSSVTLLR